MNSTRSTRRWLLAIVLLFVVGGLLWTLQHRHSASDGFQRRGELRLPILASSALQSLDPIKSVELVQYNLDLQIFECLIAVGPRGEIVPALAEKWESSQDFKVWTFHLREARFGDDPCFPQGTGRLVTVDDVLYSWKRGLNPKEGSLNSWALSTCVAGADAFTKGETKDVSGLRKISEREMRVELSGPDRDFLTRLTVLSTAVVAREAVEHYKEQFDSHPVGTGPFKLAKWASGEFVLLERNPAFGVGQGWQPAPPKLERVQFDFFRSDPQIAKAFDDGLLDMREVTGADLAQLTNMFALEQLKARYPTAEIVHPGAVCQLHLAAPMMGQQFAFGTSAALRRTLTASFDHQQLVASAVGPLGKLTKSLMLPPSVLVDGVPDGGVSGIAAEPASEALLRDRTVKIAYVSSRIGDVTVALLQKWIEQRGGKVRLFPAASNNALFGSVGEIQPDLTLLYWSPYYPNLANYLTALLSSSRPVPNFTGFTNAALDQAAQRLKVAGNEEGQILRQTIKSVLDEQMPWIPLYFDAPLVLVKPHVQNYRINPVSVMLLSGVDLAEAKAGQNRAR